MASVEQGSSGNLTPLLNGVIILPYQTLGNGVQVVASAGTAVQLASSSPIKTVTIRAYVANTTKVYVGTSSVSAANGFQLSPSETVSLDINDPSKIWLDADTDGNGVSYVTLA